MLSLDDLPPVEAMVIAVVGSVITGYGIASRSAARAMQDWPYAEGTISESRVEEIYSRGDGDEMGQTLFRPSVSYHYIVEGREYRGQRIEVGVTGVSWRSHAEGVIAHYKPGETVRVYYDPSDPRESLLVPTSAPLWASGTTVVGLVIAAAGLVWVAVAMHG